MTLVHLTLKSNNEKTGPMPVSTSARDTCPSACSFKGVDSEGRLRGCYAEGWPLRTHWNKVNTRGLQWGEFCKQIASLPPNQLWRHNQAGDLPGENNTLDTTALEQLVEANRGRQGFTYTHKPLTLSDLRRSLALELNSAGMPLEQAETKAARHSFTPTDLATLRVNRAAIATANLRGFTVNVSRDSLADLDAFGLGPLPVVVVLPMLEPGEREPKVTRSPGGNRVVTCPAQYRQTNCTECKLCAIPNRTYAIGFRAHGIAKRKVSNTISHSDGKRHLRMVG